jgi:hypothetical protein
LRKFFKICCRSMVRPSTGAPRAPAQGEDRFVAALTKNLILNARGARTVEGRTTVLQYRRNSEATDSFLCAKPSLAST